MKKLLLSSLAAVTLVGCASTGSYSPNRVVKLQEQQQVNRRKIDNKSKIYITGVVDVLQMIPKKDLSEKESLALRLAENAQQLEGLPSDGGRLKVNLLLSDNAQEKAAAQKDLLIKEEEDDKLLQAQAKIDNKLAVAQNNMLQYAEKKATENHKNWLKTFLHWILGGLGIAGTIALFIFFPPAIAIARSMINWILSIINVLIKKKG